MTLCYADDTPLNERHSCFTLSKNVDTFDSTSIINLRGKYVTFFSLSTTFNSVTKILNFPYI